MQAAQLDMAVHLGDIVFGGGVYGMSAAEFGWTLDWFLQELQDLPFPVHLLPGNHDAVLGETYAAVSRALGHLLAWKWHHAWVAQRCHYRRWAALTG